MSSTSSSSNLSALRALRLDSPRVSRTARFGRLGRLSLVVTLALVASSASFATRITSAGDPALAGALVEDFGTSALYFSSRDFLTGSDGFTISSADATRDLHLDSTFCGNFGTSGACFDTLASDGQPNDDFDVVFTGDGVSAFGFAVNALDIDWTVQTFDVDDNLLGTYTIVDQSLTLSGNNRRGYFGATEVAAIKTVTVRSAGGSDRALLDDFAFVPVPEPSTAVLAGLGLMGLASLRRARRD